MSSTALRLTPIAIVFAALYVGAVCTVAGQSAEETVFTAWRHVQLRGGPDAFRLTGRAECVVRLVPIAVAFVVGGGAVATAVRRGWRAAVPAVGIGAAAAVATEVVKVLLPHPALVTSDYAEPSVHTLPSGHVTLTAVAVLVLAVLAPVGLRPAVVGVGAVVLTVVGVTVVAIAWHRTSDVVAAILVVMAAAVVGQRWTAPSAPGPRRDRRRGPPPAVVAAVVVAAVMLVVAGLAGRSFASVPGGVSGMQPAPIADMVLPMAVVAAASSAFAAVLLATGAAVDRRGDR